MTRGVYMGIAADGRPLYVGHSGNVRRRIGDHKRKSFFAKYVARWVVLGTFDDDLQSGDYECRAIRRYRPIYNVHVNPRYRTPSGGTDYPEIGRAQVAFERSVEAV